MAEKVVIGSAEPDWCPEPESNCSYWRDYLTTVCDFREARVRESNRHAMLPQIGQIMRGKDPVFDAKNVRAPVGERE